MLLSKEETKYKQETTINLPSPCGLDPVRCVSRTDGWPLANKIRLVVEGAAPLENYSCLRRPIPAPVDCRPHPRHGREKARKHKHTRIGASEVTLGTRKHRIGWKLCSVGVFPVFNRIFWQKKPVPKGSTCFTGNGLDYCKHTCRQTCVLSLFHVLLQSAGKYHNLKTEWSLQ